MAKNPKPDGNPQDRKERIDRRIHGVHLTSPESEARRSEGWLGNLFIWEFVFYAVVALGFLLYGFWPKR